MPPHPAVRLALLSVFLGGLAACARAPSAAPPPIDVPPAIQSALLNAARQREPGISSCMAGWFRPMSATESAVAFECRGPGGPYEGAMYYAQPVGAVSIALTRIDRRPAFTHHEASGNRIGVAGSYEIVSGVVNRKAIDAMTIGYADGSFGMMQLGATQPRMYAFVHVGTVTPIGTITAYIGNQAAFVFPPPVRR